MLSGVLALAVRHDALDANPVREVARSRGRRRPRKLELTEETLAGLRVHLRGSQIARDFDLVDLVDVLSGLGCRIGELLKLDWTKVDDEVGTIRIEGTVVTRTTLAVGCERISMTQDVSMSCGMSKG